MTFLEISRKIHLSVTDFIEALKNEERGVITKPAVHEKEGHNDKA